MTYAGAVVSLNDFQRIVFFTGAGISAESGVPTYRGKGGIWKEYDYEQYACQTAFDRDPEGVWEFHNYRRGLVAACEPNGAHEQIAELAKTKQVTVITQNIDGLHELAGTEHAIELHGSLWWVRCDACGARKHDRSSPLDPLKCDTCGAYWRPDIVWFGDSLNGERIQAAVEAMQECDLFVSIGTSAVVYPAAQLPLVAKQSGATCVEINPEETPLSDVYDVHMRGTATAMLAKMA